MPILYKNNDIIFIIFIVLIGYFFWDFIIAFLGLVLEYLILPILKPIFSVLCNTIWYFFDYHECQFLLWW